MDDTSRKKYQDELKTFNKARSNARSLCNKEKIDRTKGDLKSTFKIVKSLTSENPSPILPSHTCKKQLANEFAQFFNSKITNIRNDLAKSNESYHTTSSQTSECLLNFDEFKNFAVEDVVKLAMSMKSKNNPDDPIPTWLVKECIDELYFILTGLDQQIITNCSFS